MPAGVNKRVVPGRVTGQAHLKRKNPLILLAASLGSMPVTSDRPSAWRDDDIFDKPNTETMHRESSSS
jgi:hypothetical protein